MKRLARLILIVLLSTTTLSRGMNLVCPMQSACATPVTVVTAPHRVQPHACCGETKESTTHSRDHSSIPAGKMMTCCDACAMFAPSIANTDVSTTTTDRVETFTATFDSLTVTPPVPPPRGIS